MLGLVLVTSALAALGIAVSATTDNQVVAAVGSLVLFRGRLSDRLHKGLGEVPKNVENEVATALENIAPGSRGQVELRGSQWLAQNDGGTPIESGQAVHVDRAEGVTLHVRGENI